MYKTRVSLLAGVVVIVTAIVALQGFKFSAAGEGPNHIAAGIGDLRKIEAQQALSEPGASKNGGFMIGMGDLRYSEAQQLATFTVGRGDLRYTEAQQLIPDTGANESVRHFVGMGDLRYTEAQLIPLTVGMGDLHLFEAQR